MYMFNNQKETDLQKMTTDSAHLRCTGRLFHKTVIAVSHSLRQTSQSYSYLALMMGRQQIGEGVMSGTSGAFHIYRKVDFHVVPGM